jgi:hypothetical protein
MRHISIGCVVALMAGSALTMAGCGAPVSDDPEDIGQTEEGITVDPNLSLIATKLHDATALKRFGLKRVMQQIINRMPGVGALTPTQLYQQMFDTLNDAGHAQTTGPHCSTSLNGFGLECPRTEGILAATDPFAAGAADSYAPVAIVNRFDLAPTNGADCGEYRIIYAKKSTGGLDRNFIIFEARLPNPNVAAGLQGCMPVAQMWANLSTIADPVARANQLEAFYFTGLTSGGVTFEPVVDPKHYGMTAAFGAGGSTHGQIRLNMFMIGRQYFAGGTQPPASEFWQLREMQTRKVCDAQGQNCKLEIHQVVSQNNPDASLFKKNPAVGSKAESFQTVDFLNTVSRLAQPPKAKAGAVDAAAFISMATLSKYDKGESSSDSRQDYVAAAAGNTTFLTAINTKLAALNRTDLKAGDILARATSQSCGGCHQQATGVPMGDGFSFPFSDGFIHVDENGSISPALTTVFLPHRKTVLETFVNAPAPAIAAAQAAQLDAIGGNLNN